MFNKNQKLLFNSILGVFLLVFLSVLFYYNNSLTYNENTNNPGNLLAMSDFKKSEISYENYLENLDKYSDIYDNYNLKNKNLGNFYGAIKIGHSSILSKLENIIEKINKNNNDLTKEEIYEIMGIIGGSDKTIEQINQLLIDEFEIDISIDDLKEIKDKLKNIEDEKKLMDARLEKHLNDAYKELSNKNSELTNYLKRQIIRANPGISEEELNNILQDLYSKFDNIKDPKTLNQELIDFVKYANDEYGVKLDLKIVSQFKFDITEIEGHINKLEGEILYNAGVITDEEYNDMTNSIDEYVSQVDKENDLIQNMTQNQINSIIEGDADYEDVRDEVIEDILNEENDEIINPDELIDEEFESDEELINNKNAIAYIENITGDVLYTNLAGSTQRASMNQLLYEGYKIQTINDATVSIIFEDDSVLRLGSNTEIIIEDKDGGNIVITNIIGDIWSRVLKTFSSNEEFIIKSDNVSAAIRGTAVLFEVTKSGRSNVSVVDSSNDTGSVEVSSGNDNKNLGKRKKTSFYDGVLEEVEDFNRTFSNEFLKENTKRDLLYMNVLSNDRQRLFNNNPVSDGRFDNDFLDKVTNEIASSLPDDFENFFINNELKNYILDELGDDVTSENIYELIIKDNIISNIKKESDSSDDVNNLKDDLINGFLELNTNEIKESLGNLRELNTRISLGIEKEIIKKAEEDEDFRGDLENRLKNEIEIFNMSEIKLIKRKLQDLKDDFENNGDSYLNSEKKEEEYNFNLKDKKDDINISWKYRDTSNGNWENIYDNNFSYDRNIYGEGDKNIEFKAIFELDGHEEKIRKSFKIEQKEETTEQKLERYALALKGYISGILVFNDNVDLTDFIFNDFEPKVEWQEGEHVIGNGILIRPKYAEGDKENVEITAKITLDGETREENFNITILKKDVTKEEINTELTKILGGKELPGTTKTINLPSKVYGKSINWFIDENHNIKEDDSLKIENNKLNLLIDSLSGGVTRTLYAKNDSLNLTKNIDIKINSFGNCEFNGITILHDDTKSFYQEETYDPDEDAPNHIEITCEGGELSGVKTNIASLSSKDTIDLNDEYENFVYTSRSEEDENNCALDNNYILNGNTTLGNLKRIILEQNIDDEYDKKIVLFYCDDGKIDEKTSLEINLDLGEINENHWNTFFAGLNNNNNVIHIPDLPIPVKEGYIFTGWDKNLNDNSNFDEKRFILDNEIEAEWVEISSYEDCDTPDIILNNGQIWSACNVGSTKSGTGSESFGDIKNFYNAKDTCMGGYKLPTKNDWQSALDVFGGDYESFIDGLKLPKVGYNKTIYSFPFRRTLQSGGNYGMYHTSSEKIVSQYYRVSITGDYSFTAIRLKSQDWATRCIKDTDTTNNYSPNGTVQRGLTPQASDTAIEAINKNK